MSWTDIVKKEDKQITKISHNTETNMCNINKYEYFEDNINTPSNIFDIYHETDFIEILKDMQKLCYDNGYNILNLNNLNLYKDFSILIKNNIELDLLPKYIELNEYETSDDEENLNNEQINN